MENTIKITKCDNELILVAYQWGASYEICNIKSGNSNAVDVTLNIVAGKAGDFKTVELNGVSGPLTKTCQVTLPPGLYNFTYIGVNWGGPCQFALAFNGVPYDLPFQGEARAGAIWNHSAASPEDGIQFTVK